MSSTGGAHVLVFPYPAQGHMLALLDLTHHLVIRGLTITILVTPKNLPILHPLLSTHPSIQTLVLPFPDHPSLPAGVENVKDIGSSGNVAIMNALGKLRDPITHWFKSHPSPPDAIISDFFLGWTHHLATHLGVPRIAFHSIRTFTASVLDYLLTNLSTVRSVPAVSFSDLPGSHTFPREHLPSMYQRYRESDPEWEFVRDGIIANSASWGSVFNTFDALEGKYLDHLRKEFGHPRVWGVGPLILKPEAAGPTTERGGPTSVTAHEVMTWLDRQPDGSVVYLCFGSQKALTRQQTEALAVGLEKSGAPFIWVMKVATDGCDVIPAGFEDRVAGRGLVIRGWAPQVSILSHRAVGGFLTHCGWNSVVESILLGGVMLLAWPMEADQFLNARLMVEEMGAAVRVCEGDHAVPDSAELARTIRESMAGSRPEKVRAIELRDKATEAVKEGGSSFGDLDGLVSELLALQHKKRNDVE